MRPRCCEEREVHVQVLSFGVSLFPSSTIATTERATASWSGTWLSDLLQEQCIGSQMTLFASALFQAERFEGIDGECSISGIIV
jgi:hypothetical protein